MDAGAAKEAIGLDNVRFKYEGQQGCALDGVSLSIAPGQMVVVMGASGAGKSTLARCLNRSIPTFQRGRLDGTIRLLGRGIERDTVGDLAGTIGLVAQDFEAQLFATNVAQEVVFGMEQMGVDRSTMASRLAAALRMVGLVGFERRDPATLSGGEKQRLAIAATVALEPKILVLDEPTTDLDPVGKAEVLRALAALRGRGLTLLVIEHEIAAAQAADRLILLSRGKVVADGAPAELCARAELLEACAVRPPDLTLLGARLGLDPVPKTVDAAVARLASCPRTPAMAREATARPHRESVPIIELRQVSFEYSSGKPVLREIDFAVFAGDFIAVIGQNGSGKTSLAKHFNGLLRPTRGTVLLDGECITQREAKEIAATVGYVFQNPDTQIFAATVADEVAFGPRNLGLSQAEVRDRVTESLAAVGLANATAEDPFLMNKGARQRLAVASALALRPRALLLDEPTTGLDYAEQCAMMELLSALRRRGTAIIIITHTPWIASEYAQRGTLLSGGHILFDGDLKDLLQRDEDLERAHFVTPELRRVAQRLGLDAASVADFEAAFVPGGGTCR